VLLVEDDTDVARFIRKGLTEQTYAVDLAEDGDRALYLASVNPYDAVILDLMIPGPDGMEVCRRLRRSKSATPVLMLTARDSVEDKIAGLDAGADDYLAKPFEFGELVARLRALLRRGGATISTLLDLGDLQIDTRSHHVTIGGKTLTLTTKEYAILEYMARNAGRVITREEIAEHVWNQQFDAFTNVIEVYINRLRRHIEHLTDKKLIQTIRGSGYILSVSGT
jgi:two-component system copper resistance phosphate regulon response regulator CusR